jgi:hypothetical protein
MDRYHALPHELIVITSPSTKRLVDPKTEQFAHYEQQIHETGQPIPAFQLCPQLRP